MACFSPLSAFQTDSGDIVFAERGKIRRALELPCGQCVGCRLERSRQWAVRCMHESQMHAFSSFVTLTYDTEHLPKNSSLEYHDFQVFMRRVRTSFPGARFYMCGEYGELNWRPHYHACLFGVFFDDRVMFKESGSGYKIYESKSLSAMWDHGFASVADFSFETAAYVARYVMKKVTGARAAAHYRRHDLETGEAYSLRPEFTKMSLKPGIGATWFEKYHKQTYPRDYVVVRGMKCKPPRYYDKLLELSADFRHDEVEYERFLAAQRAAEDNTPERLEVRRQVTEARLRSKVRTL